MSRRKVRGLTKTGRQVSEDPDLDNLLSNLSPEEMEELQKEVSVVPDPDPSEIIIVDQTDLKAVPPAKKDSQPGSQEKSGFQRNLSTEGEPKKESRKQEYLRKMGLSQEKNISRSDSIEGGLQRQTSITSPSSFPKHDGKTEDRSSRVTEGNKDDKAGPSFFSKKEEESEKKGEVKEKEQNDGNKLRDRRETRESSSSKTKELISKLQEKKEDAKEKSRKEDSRKRESGESRAKEMISRIKEKEEKEKEKKDEIRKREENKIKSNTSRLEEKQNEVLENKAEDKRKEEKKNKDDKQVVKDDKQVVKDDKQVVKDNKQVVKDDKQVVKSNESGKEGPTKDEKKHAEHKDKEQVEKGKEKIKIPDTRNADSCEKGKREIQEHNEITNEVHESIKEDKIGNCVSDTISKSKTKEEEEEDESASMFDEDLERVRRNDPGMTEVNVNNSEVIKTKTLIQFAEALKNNTHIKSFSLANCRADDHVAYAIAETLRSNKSITSVNMDSNLLTSKGIMALIYALQHNSTLTELRFHNQRHICGGKSEMEMTKILKENTTLLKLGYHFELAGPRMTMTNILSRNMDRQRQKRLQEQKQAQAQGTGDKKDSLEVPRTSFGKGSPKASPKASPKPSPLPSPIPSPAPSPKLTHKKGGRGPGGGPPPPPPPGGPPPPPPPMLDGDFLKNSLTPVSQRKLEDRTGGRGASQNSRDQLLASIRGSNIKQLKKVSVPKLLQ